MSERQAVLVIIAVTLIIRVGLAAVTGLGIDESYMVSHARDLSLSYVDQPPLHVWIVGVLAKLSGSENGLLLRMPFILMFAGSTWLLYRLTALLFDEKAGLWAVGLFNLSPFFTIAGGTWVLPEGPVDFFMLAGANVVARILIVPPEPHGAVAPWLLAGLLGGLAMLGKYHGVFLFVGTFAFLLTAPSPRRHLATPAPWLGAALGLLVFTPVIVWNLTHDLAGLRFQSARLDNPGLSPVRLLQSIAEQAAYFGVWNVAPLVAGLYGAFRRGPAAKPSWFVALVAIGPIVVFTGATLWSPGLPHWTAQGWLFAMPLAGAVAARWSLRAPRFMAYSMVGATVAMIAFLAVALSQVATGWASRLFPAGSNDVTRDLLNWTELRAGLEAQGLMKAGTIVAATNWIPAGKTSYALGPETQVLCLCDRPQHFAYRYAIGDFAGRDIVVVKQRGGPGATADIDRYFARVEPQGSPVVIHRLSGDPAISLDIFVGRDFRPAK